MTAKLAFLNKHIEIQHSYQQVKAFEHQSADLCQQLSPNGLILDGLFKGMKYPSYAASGSTLVPKILGCYESELIPAFEHLDPSYEIIIDIGCAEGFYATGLALRYPNAIVHSYYTDASALARATAMAEANGVADRIRFHALATVAELASADKRRALVIVDCEGDERFLFSHQNIKALCNSDLIIELHPHVYPDMNEYLQSLFAATHSRQLITAVPDQQKNIDLPPIRHLPLETRKLCVAEFRGNFQQWMVCTPRREQSHEQAMA